jgi:hypothetical protein
MVVMPFVGGGSVYGLFQMLLNDLNFIKYR